MRQIKGDFLSMENKEATGSGAAYPEFIRGSRQASSPVSSGGASTVGSNVMRGFGAVCISLLLTAIPATASDQNLKEELGKIGSAYEQHFSNKDAAGITSLYTKNYMRVTEDGVVDNTRYYENAFKAGVSRLEVKMTEVQSLSENMALVRRISRYWQQRDGRSHRLHRCLDRSRCS